MKEKESSTPTMGASNGRNSAETQFRAMFENNCTYEEIAKYFGVTRKTISNWAKNLGLTRKPIPRKLSLERLLEIKNLSAKGLAIKDISKITKISSHTISKIVQNCSREEIIEDTIKLVQLRFLEGKSLARIKEETHLSVPTILKYRDMSYSQELITKYKIQSNINSLLDLHYTSEEIANLLNISKQRVEYWEKLRRLPPVSVQIKPDEPPYYSEVDKQNALNYLFDGLSYREVAEITGIAGSTIWRWAKEANIAYNRPRGKKAEHLQKIIEYRKKGYTLRVIAILTGLNPNTITRWLNQITENEQ